MLYNLRSKELVLQELLLAYGLMSYVYPSAINSQLHVNLHLSNLDLSEWILHLVGF